MAYFSMITSSYQHQMLWDSLAVHELIREMTSSACSRWKVYLCGNHEQRFKCVLVQPGASPASNQVFYQFNRVAETNPIDQ